MCVRCKGGQRAEGKQLLPFVSVLVTISVWAAVAPRAPAHRGVGVGGSCWLGFGSTGWVGADLLWLMLRTLHPPLRCSSLHQPPSPPPSAESRQVDPPSTPCRHVGWRAAFYCSSRACWNPNSRFCRSSEQTGPSSPPSEGCCGSPPRGVGGAVLLLLRSFNLSVCCLCLQTEQSSGAILKALL